MNPNYSDVRMHAIFWACGPMRSEKSSSKPLPMISGGHLYFFFFFFFLGGGGGSYNETCIKWPR